jgi:hypothetical protein
MVQRTVRRGGGAFAVPGMRPERRQLLALEHPLGIAAVGGEQLARLLGAAEPAEGPRGEDRELGARRSGEGRERCLGDLERRAQASAHELQAHARRGVGERRGAAARAVGQPRLGADLLERLVDADHAPAAEACFDQATHRAAALTAAAVAQKPHRVGGGALGAGEIAVPQASHRDVVPQQGRVGGRDDAAAAAQRLDGTGGRIWSIWSNRSGSERGAQGLQAIPAPGVSLVAHGGARALQRLVERRRFLRHRGHRAGEQRRPPSVLGAGRLAGARHPRARVVDVALFERHAHGEVGERELLRHVETLGHELGDDAARSTDATEVMEAPRGDQPRRGALVAGDALERLIVTAGAEQRVGDREWIARRSRRIARGRAGFERSIGVAIAKRWVRRTPLASPFSPQLASSIPRQQLLQLLHRARFRQQAARPTLGSREPRLHCPVLCPAGGERAPRDRERRLPQERRRGEHVDHRAIGGQRHQLAAPLRAQLARGAAARPATDVGAAGEERRQQRAQRRSPVVDGARLDGDAAEHFVFAHAGGGEVAGEPPAGPPQVRQQRGRLQHHRETLTVVERGFGEARSVRRREGGVKQPASGVGRRPRRRRRIATATHGASPVRSVARSSQKRG